MDDKKHERFCKIAERRVNQIIDDMEKLGNCSAKASYDYTEAEVEQIIAALEKEIVRLRERFEGKTCFTLRD